LSAWAGRPPKTVRPNHRSEKNPGHRRRDCEFGNVPIGERTKHSELFINPLMAVYFTVELNALARRNLYLDTIRHTYTTTDVVLQIQKFRDELTEVRPQRTYPH
jgi:hypothetical protein